MTDKKTFLACGLGYTALVLCQKLLSEGWHVIGTTRSEEKARQFSQRGFEALIWSGDDLEPALARASHVLISAAPGEMGDPFLNRNRYAFEAAANSMKWCGYLSTIGVYGDHQGAWVDEQTPLTPGTDRGKRRVDAEKSWQSISGLPLHIFRLPGIYGPGRGPLEKLRKGPNRAILKQGQFFSRIHVQDIVTALRLSMKQPKPGEVYNICDDHPAPPEDVLDYAASLLGLPRPERVLFEDAVLSQMAKSFFAESKRVSNTKAKKELEWVPQYPDYKSGLEAILDEEGKS